MYYKLKLSKFPPSVFFSNVFQVFVHINVSLTYAASLILVYKELKGHPNEVSSHYHPTSLTPWSLPPISNPWLGIKPFPEQSPKWSLFQSSMLLGHSEMESRWRWNWRKALGVNIHVSQDTSESDKISKSKIWHFRKERTKQSTKNITFTWERAIPSSSFFPLPLSFFLR